MSATVITDPSQANRIFAAALNRGDIDAVMSLFEPDAQMMTPEGTCHAGAAAIRAAFGAFIANPGVLESDTVVTMVQGDIALLRSQWRFTTTGGDGTPVEIGGKSAEVLRRQRDGTWRYVLDNAATI